MVNNYIKISINGKEAGLVFGLLQVKEFEKACIGNIDLFFDENNFITEAGLTRLIYAANQNHRFSHPSAESLTMDEIYKWLVDGRTDKKVLDQVLEIVKVWLASEFVQTWLDEKKKEMEKVMKAITKSQQSKTSKGSSTTTKRSSGQRVTGQKK